MVGNTDNIFRKILRGEASADVVYEDADMIAFRDLYPAAPHHILIIPRKPIDTLSDANAQDVELLGKMLLRAASLAKAMGVADKGYRCVINCNEEGGQTVYHLHLNLLAGRALGWPPG